MVLAMTLEMTVALTERLLTQARKADQQQQLLSCAKRRIHLE